MRKRCLSCGRKLTRKNGAWICEECNSRDLSLGQLFGEAADSEYLYIECPGATLYKEGTNEVEAGVKWLDEDNPAAGYEIVDHAVFAPEHTHRRRIKPEAFGKIRRCRACQDLTVRMRRREGPDFFIPSSKHPGRTKLKPVAYRQYE